LLQKQLLVCVRHPKRKWHHRDISSRLASNNRLKAATFRGKDIEKDVGQDIQPCEVKTEITPSTPLISQRLDTAIEITLKARANFSGGFLIPVVLMLAVTAATFYGAYSALGDKDKAFALAYCVWYSWILVVSVGGNCFATSISSKLATKAFAEILDLDSQGSVALRDRSVNSQTWEAWAEHNDGTRFDLKSQLGAMQSN
jgi:hypothetical protein